MPNKKSIPQKMLQTRVQRYHESLTLSPEEIAKAEEALKNTLALYHRLRAEKEQKS